LHGGSPKIQILIFHSYSVLLRTCIDLDQNSTFLLTLKFVACLVQLTV
jgi:hypothetical protein